jgi:hypothetical protein
MQPPFTQSCPAGHAALPSAVAHGATQCASTQTVPPWQLALLVHGLGLTLHTPLVKSHEYPVGQGDPAVQWGSHKPSTQASPVTRHCEVSEHKLSCAVHWPSTHRDPETVQSESALQGTGPPASASGAESVVPDASSPLEASGLPSSPALASPDGVASSPEPASFAGG